MPQSGPRKTQAALFRDGRLPQPRRNPQMEGPSLSWPRPSR
jgi:hypothetical protein